MVRKIEDSNSTNDMLYNIRLFMQYVHKRFWLLKITLLLGIIAGVAYYFIQKPKYEAICTFILEERSAGSGGLAGLASQFGVSLGDLGSGGSIFAGDNILNILKSKKVVRQVLLSPVNIDSDSSKSLADYYLGTIEAHDSQQQIFSLSSSRLGITEDNMTAFQDSILNSIYNKLIEENISTEKVSRQGTIIKVQVTAEDDVFARLMSEGLVNEASRLYLNIRVGSAQENINKLQKRSDSLLLLLNNRTFHAAVSQPLDINPGIRSAVVPVEIANRDKTIVATLYAEVTKNLEASKLLLAQQTPVIELLDRPEQLLHNNKRSLIFLLFVSLSAAGLIYMTSVFILFLVQQALGQLESQNSANSK